MSSHFVSKPTLTSRPPSGRKATRQCCPDLLSSSTTCINWRQHYGNQGHVQCHWNDVLGNYWIDWFLHCFVSPQIINATMRVKKSLPKTTKRTTLAQMMQRKDRQTEAHCLIKLSRTRNHRVKMVFQKQTEVVWCHSSNNLNKDWIGWNYAGKWLGTYLTMLW